MDLFMQGATLMVIGMATVFAFLGLMIAIMNGIAALIRRNPQWFPEEVKVPKKAVPKAVDPEAEIAIALAAIRARRG
jgi:sodium pump decarboxylase gamma subunit